MNYFHVIYFLSRELDAMSGQWFYSKFRESKRNRKTKKVITGPDLVRTSIRRRGFCKSTICYFLDEISYYLSHDLYCIDGLVQGCSNSSALAQPLILLRKENLYFHEGSCITLLDGLEEGDRYKIWWIIIWDFRISWVYLQFADFFVFQSLQVAVFGWMLCSSLIKIQRKYF